MINLVKENTFIVSGLLLFFACLKLKLYYDGFDISILHYVNFSEILITLINDIFIFLLVVLAIYSVSTALFFALHFSSKVKTVYNSVSQKPEIWLLVFIVGSILMIYLLLQDIISYGWFTIYFTILSVSQAVTYFFKIINDNPNAENLESTKKVKSNTEYMVSLIICFFVFIFCNSHNEIKKTKRAHSLVTIYGNDTIVCSKKTGLIFVGKTDNFLFVYNDSTKTSKAISMSEVKMIEQINFKQ